MTKDLPDISGNRAGSGALVLLRVAAIAAAGAWVYAPAIRGGWIWDDLEEVAANPALRDPAGLANIWLGRSGADYLPLKSTLQWVEWRLWGDSTLGYHLVSLGLHVLSALLLWRLLSKLGVRSAWLGGLVFAVHPVAVESVAWVAELKNTLSLPPLLLAMGAYAAFDREGRRRDLLLAAAWFTAAMLCKSSVVMLPLILLLFAWWRRGRIGRRDLVCAAPFLAISVALGLVAVWFQEERAVAGRDLGIGGAWTRFALSGRALVFYLGKSLAPLRLMPVYPRWGAQDGAWRLCLPWLLLGAAGAAIWRHRRGWGRHAALAAGFFALNLVPVLGLVPMAYLRLSWVADHFAYISLLAAAGLAAAGMDVLLLRAGRTAASLIAALAVGSLALESRGLAEIYRGDDAFWAFAAERNPGAWIAHGNLGLVLNGRGDVKGAIAEYRQALRINPDDAAAHVNLGNALARTGRAKEAAEEFASALRIRPDDTDARTDLGNLDLAGGRFGAAVDEYESVLRVRPGDPGVARSCAEARYRRGNELANTGRLGDAVSDYTEALRLWPALVEARANLGLALSAEGLPAEAIAVLEEAVRAKPDYAEAHAYLGLALFRAGRPGEAVAEYEEALKRDPDSADIHYNLAVALKAAGRPSDAAAHFEAAARLGAGR